MPQDFTGYYRIVAPGSNKTRYRQPTCFQPAQRNRHGYAFLSFARLREKSPSSRFNTSIHVFALLTKTVGRILQAQSPPQSRIRVPMTNFHLLACRTPQHTPAGTCLTRTHENPTKSQLDTFKLGRRQWGLVFTAVTAPPGLA